MSDSILLNDGLGYLLGLGVITVNYSFGEHDHTAVLLSESRGTLLGRVLLLAQQYPDAHITGSTLLPLPDLFRCQAQRPALVLPPRLTRYHEPPSGLRHQALHRGQCR